MNRTTVYCALLPCRSSRPSPLYSCFTGSWGEAFCSACPSFGALPERAVVINEFLAHTDDPELDYIELYNHSLNPVDVSGCILTDDPATNKFVIPSGTVIAPGGFVYYSQTTMNFSLDAAGETIYFVNPIQTRIFLWINLHLGTGYPRLSEASDHTVQLIRSLELIEIDKMGSFV